jgi:hypothetical protein
MSNNSFIILCEIVILFVLCSLARIKRLNIPNNQETPINQHTELYDKTKIINELIRIEKKISFYDILQHHYLFSDGNGHLKSNKWNQDKRIIILEYITRLNNIDSSIFEKKADEMLLSTPYIRSGSGLCDGVINDIRTRNVGYIIDSKFIENIVLNSRCISQLDKSEQHKNNTYENELIEFANDFHYVFYGKLKKEYQKIEYKYTLISSDFNELYNYLQIKLF